MPFIGNQPSLSYTSFAKQDFTTSATTSYTLDNPVANENEIALFINFVRQEPTTAYTASGTTLTLTSATSATDDMYCVFLGKAVQTVTPASGSVTNDMISYPLTKSGATVSTFNRTTSVGSVLDIQKDATSVGTISANDGDLLVGTGDTGLRFYDAGDAIIPNNNSTLGNRDNAIDLGISSVRYKDLYLSGGAYLGGTTSANYLDDYEVGDWTPVLGAYGGTPTINNSHYIKIGKLVMASTRILLDGTSDASNFQIAGLPFTCKNTTNDVFGAIIGMTTSTVTRINILVNRNNTDAYLYNNDGSIMSYNTFGNDKQIRLSIIYQTD